MTRRTAVLGWALAALFAAATALFAWQYALARRDATTVRRDYESLHQRVEEQARRNDELDATLRALAKQLTDAQTRVELLGQAAASNPTP